LLLAVENQLVWLDLLSGEVTAWLTLEDPQPGVRLNDGRCDPMGRFWIGGMYDPTSANRFEAFLHRVEPDGSFATVRSQVGCANGLAFSPDGTVMYWADTLNSLVWAYDYDVATGEQRNERIFLDFGPLPGRPDGACVDEAGCYWIACVGGAAVLRATPDGAVDRIVDVPVLRPTMPAFGGADLATMFITSIAARDLKVDGPGPHGAIFAFAPGVRGLPEPVFAG
jgi:sugar lactone lactonase YvrE